MQRKELLQLPAEVRTALGGTRVAGGEVERQCGERIGHAEVAHLLPVDGFHTDDAHDDFGRHAVFLLGPLQRCAVLLPEAHPGADTDGVDEPAAVNRPVFRGTRAGRCHEAGDGGQLARLANGLAHPFRVHAAARGHIVGKSHGIGAGGVAGGTLGLGSGRVVAADALFAGSLLF